MHPDLSKPGPYAWTWGKEPIMILVPQYPSQALISVMVSLSETKCSNYNPKPTHVSQTDNTEIKPECSAAGVTWLVYDRQPLCAHCSTCARDSSSLSYTMTGVQEVWGKQNGLWLVSQCPCKDGYGKENVQRGCNFKINSTGIKNMAQGRALS